MNETVHTKVGSFMRMGCCLFCSSYCFYQGCHCVHYCNRQPVKMGYSIYIHAVSPPFALCFTGVWSGMHSIQTVDRYGCWCSYKRWGMAHYAESKLFSVKCSFNKNKTKNFSYLKWWLFYRFEILILWFECRVKFDVSKLHCVISFNLHLCVICVCV